MPKDIKAIYSTAIPHRLTVAGSMVALLLGAACSGMNPTEQRVLSGGAIGAAGGAALGALTGGSPAVGAVIGGAAGAAAGYLLGEQKSEKKKRN
jgi:hypothetical protein